LFSANNVQSLTSGGSNNYNNTSNNTSVGSDVNQLSSGINIGSRNVLRSQNIINLGNRNNALANTDNIILGTNNNLSPLVSNCVSMGNGSTLTQSSQINNNGITSLKVSNLFQGDVGIGMNQLLMDSLGEVYRQSSSIRGKDNIKKYTCSELYNLQPRSYTVNGVETFGLIAEEVEAAGFPELCTYDEFGVVLGVNYSMLTIPLLEGLFQLHGRLIK
jgi:hypothetical protein